MLFRPWGRIRKFRNWNLKPRTLLCNRKLGNSSRKNMFLQNTLCAAGTWNWEIGTFSDIFFRNVTNKKVQNAKKRKMQKCPENTRNLGVFIENRAVAICRSIEKVSKMTPNPRAHSVHFFSRNSARGILGFSDFQLRIEVKFRKKAFSTFFGKIFTFLRFTGWRSTAPFFTWGENLNFAFSKSGTRFRFWVRFCAAFTRENPSGRK
jgi:hypothetical protein